MDMQIDITQELDLNNEILRDLLDSEVVLVGGGEAALGFY
jgi:hypothetical protein